MQTFDYFCVLDFEATCKEGSVIEPQEIIEFPVVVLNADTLQVLNGHPSAEGGLNRIVSATSPCCSLEHHCLLPAQKAQGASCPIWSVSCAVW